MLSQMSYDQLDKVSSYVSKWLMSINYDLKQYFLKKADKTLEIVSGV